MTTVRGDSDTAAVLTAIVPAHGQSLVTNRLVCVYNEPPPFAAGAAQLGD